MRGLRRLVGVGALAGTLAACGGGSSGGGGSGGGSFPGYLPSAAVLANPGGAQDFEFGSAVVWLDWNGDGRPDLVVGSPGQSNGGLAGVGAAVLYLQAPDHSFAFARSFVPSNWAGVTAATGQRFGETLATGDFDGDGLPDLVIGAPGDAVGPNADAGRVYVVFNDVAHTGALVGPIADPTGASTGAEFGSTLATGALNADVRTDLAVGAQGATVSTFAGAGQVVALYGTASQASFGSVASAAITSIVPTLDGGFGASIAIGDVSGDGLGDLVVGEPGAADGSGGKVQIFTGSGGAPGTFAHARDLTTSAPGLLVEFGSAVGLGDFDGDGHLDVVVGAPFGDVGTTTEAGYVIVYRAVDPATLAFTPGAPVGNRAPEGGAQFGDVIVVADVDGDAKPDLLVGAPAATASSQFGAGSVTYLQGTGAGGFASPRASDVLHALAPVEDAAFGAAVAAADVDGDGHLDLAIGAPGPVDVLTPQAGAVEVIFAK